MFYIALHAAVKQYNCLPFVMILARFLTKNLNAIISRKSHGNLSFFLTHKTGWKMQSSTIMDFNGAEC